MAPVASTRNRTDRREEIVAAAVRFLEDHDLDELSMRRLAAELGVGTMTLYVYFRDKDELIDAIVDALPARRPLPELRGPWRRQLRDLMRHFLATLQQHPHLVKVRLARPIATPKAFRITEEGLRILREAGFDEREAVSAFRTLFIYVFGSAAFNPPEHAEAMRRASLAAIAVLPPDQYPHVSSALADFGRVFEPEEQFLRGLDHILDGFEAALEKGR